MFEEINIELMKKYDKPGPRYTSYPPAPLFSSEFTADDFRDTIAANNAGESTADLSLYYHIPFCDMLCYFCGCNMVVSRNQERMKEYVEKVTNEMRMVHQLLSPRRLVTQLHWGGGSPSSLSPDNILLLGDAQHKFFRFHEEAEIGVEIDPRGLTFEHMKAFRQAGCNRMSMGVQDFEPEIQRLINRVQSEQITKDALDWARALNFKSVNIDLVYGLPLQTTAQFEETLDTIIAFSPERIAVFNFAYVPWMKPHQKLIKKEWLPSPEEKLHILKITIEKLTGSGYVYIGMDHFAKPDDELTIAQKEKTLYRNFQGYSTHAGADLYAFGVSSISQFHAMYAQNQKKIQDYYSAIESGQFATASGYRMTQDDLIRKEVIMRIMCDMELNKTYIEKKFRIDFDRYFEDSLNKLEPLIQDNLLSIEGNMIVVSSMGRLLIRNIAMCFDAYLDKMMKEKPLFSRTV